MLRLLKWLFVGGPAVLLLGVVACQTKDVASVSVVDPADMIWGEGSSAIHFEVTEARNDERGVIRTVAVEAIDARGQTLLRRSLDINEDDWGGGVVGGMQVDGDPELELVVWGAHEPRDRSFFLDHADGAVEALPFYLAYDEAKARASRYHQVHNLAPGGVVLLVFFGIVYYMGVGFLWLIIRAARRPPPVPDPEPAPAPAPQS